MAQRQRISARLRRPATGPRCSFYDGSGPTTINDTYVSASNAYGAVQLYYANPAGPATPAEVVTANLNVTGVAGGTLVAPLGVMPDCVVLGPANGALTSIASGSNGNVLPQGTIHVGSCNGFPAPPCSLYVTIAGAQQQVFYTGTNGTVTGGVIVGGTTFTGCFGGNGTLATDQDVGDNGPGGSTAIPLYVVATGIVSINRAGTGLSDAALTAAVQQAISESLAGFTSQDQCPIGGLNESGGTGYVYASDIAACVGASYGGATQAQQSAASSAMLAFAAANPGATIAQLVAAGASSLAESQAIGALYNVQLSWPTGESVSVSTGEIPLIVSPVPTSAGCQITGCVAGGGGLCEFTTSAASGVVTGATLYITGVQGVAGAGGSFVVTVVDATHFTIPVAFSGTYTGGGVAAFWRVQVYG